MTFKILSIDGGGIRGIIPAKIIEYMEKRVKEITKNQGARIVDYVDMVAGTSTGGILASIYTMRDEADPDRAKFSAAEALDFYLDKGKNMFKLNYNSLFGLLGDRYDAANLEKIFEQNFGKAKLSNSYKNLFLTSYNIEKRYAHFFSSKDASLDRGYDYYVKDICRATSAAPTYFKPALVTSLTNEKYPLVDGGLYANDPTMCAIVEAYESFGRTFDDIYSLSIGTGIIEKPYPYSKAKEWGIPMWAVPVVDITTTSGPDVVDYQLRKIFDKAGVGAHYTKLNFKIPKGPMEAMDNVKKDNIENLVKLTDKFIEDKKDFIEVLVHELMTK